MRRTPRAAIAVGVLLLGALQGGCASGTTSAGSRTTLYGSMDELARDSTAIVLGTVVMQHGAGDATVSGVEVLSAPWAPYLGQSAPSDEPVEVGDVVQVRQDAASPPLLKEGQEYVLWLTPTMLPGDAGDQFYITGANAGLYIRDGDTARRAATDTGDDLPDTISISG